MLQQQNNDGFIYQKMLSTHPVHYVVVMAESYSLQQHHHVALDLAVSERPVWVPDHFRQIGEHVLKNEHKAGAMWKDVVKLHDLLKATAASLENLSGLFVFKQMKTILLRLL